MLTNFANFESWTNTYAQDCKWATIEQQRQFTCGIHSKSKIFDQKSTFSNVIIVSYEYSQQPLDKKKITWIIIEKQKTKQKHQKDSKKVKLGR